ncbi:MAG: CDP-alcohol phosphatidyltransferase family protein [Planctomycetota bacterium]|jgi:CDP-diacylglycerol--glycerol-3-phosphate 3-phosphatidyltransferase
MTWLTWPNRITIARILLVAPVVVCLLNLNAPWPPARRLALGLFCLIALGDALDGYLARRRHEETPLGRFLDPLADKLLLSCSVVLLALPGTAIPGAKLPNWVPVLAIGKDLLVVLGFALVYATTGRFFVRPRLLGKGCTVVQSAMIMAVLLAPDLPAGFRRLLPVLYWMTGGLAVVAAVDYLRIGNRFARQVHQQRPPSERFDE